MHTKKWSDTAGLRDTDLFSMQIELHSDRTQTRKVIIYVGHNAATDVSMTPGFYSVACHSEGPRDRGLPPLTEIAAETIITHDSETTLCLVYVGPVYAKRCRGLCKR